MGVRTIARDRTQVFRTILKSLWVCWEYWKPLVWTSGTCSGRMDAAGWLSCPSQISRTKCTPHKEWIQLNSQTADESSDESSPHKHGILSDFRSVFKTWISALRSNECTLSPSSMPIWQSQLDSSWLLTFVSFVLVNTEDEPFVIRCYESNNLIKSFSCSIKHRICELTRI